MAFEHKDGKGSLFKNKEKEADTHSDYKGSLRLDGKDYWVNGWINEKKDGSGEKYLGLTVKPKQQGEAKDATQQPMNDDIPF